MRKLLPLSLIPILLFSFNLSAAELADVEQQLQQDIQQAQEQLSASEATISEERGELSIRINSVQNEVLDLREEAVAARRVADEETLSLGQIESRLDEWQRQSQFQSRLLAGFLNRSGKRSLTDAGTITMENDLEIFAQLVAEQEDLLYPDWQTEKLVMPDGQIKDASLLSLGPVHIFTIPAEQLSGLVNRTEDMNSVSMLFSPDSQQDVGLQSLKQNLSGTLTFDPTLSQALLLAGNEETIMEHLQKGGVWVIPILLFALFATLTAILKGISLFRMPALSPALADRIENAMKEGPEAVQTVSEKIKGQQAELLKIALAPATSQQREERLYAALMEQKNKLERWLGAIAITASVSPLLGLLGTVSGMIATFKLMTLFGAGDASSVSSGISEALVTTEMGLIVAIPALLAHALMSRKVKSYFSQLENDAVHLSQLPLAESQP